MRSLFNADSWLWKPLGWLGDLVMLSLLWAFCSIPLVTLGPACAAVYDAAVHAVRRKEDTVITRFLHTFKRDLKQGIFSGLFWAGVVLLPGLLLYALLRFVPFFAERWPLVLVVAAALGFFLLCVLCWVWPTLSRFAMGLGALHVTAVKLAFGHILRSAAMALIWVAALGAGLRYAFAFFVAPGLAAYLSTYLIEPVFRPFEEQEQT